MLVDVEVSPGDTIIVLRRNDGTCTVSLPRHAIEKALATPGAVRVDDCGCVFDPAAGCMSICAKHIMEPHH